MAGIVTTGHGVTPSDVACNPRRVDVAAVRGGWLLAALVCAFFWATAIWRVETREAAPRELTFAQADGKRVEDVICSSPAFADGTAVWRECLKGDDSRVLARLEPARGIAKIVAPAGRGVLRGMARSADGDIAALLDDRLVVVRGETLARTLDLALEGGSPGFGWRDGEIEVAASFPARVLRWRDGSWVERRIADPVVAAGAKTWMLRAMPSPERWTFVHVVAPSPEGPEPKDVEILTCDEAGAVLDRQTVHAEGFSSLIPLDGSPGNVVPALASPTWLERRAGRWAPLVLPPDATQATGESYVLHADCLEPVPQAGIEHVGETARVGDRWIRVGRGFYGEVVPADGGGVWRLAPSSYVRLDESGRRIDAPGFLERLGLLFARAGWPQCVALFWALFLLPLLALAARAWLRPSVRARVVTCYAIASFAGAWWVWSLLADL